METCILTLLVTLEQEQAIRKLFKRRGWDFKTTDSFSSEGQWFVPTEAQHSNKKKDNKSRRKLRHKRSTSKASKCSGSQVNFTDESVDAIQDPDSRAVITRSLKRKLLETEENEKNALSQIVKFPKKCMSEKKHSSGGVEFENMCQISGLTTNTAQNLKIELPKRNKAGQKTLKKSTKTRNELDKPKEVSEKRNDDIKSFSDNKDDICSNNAAIPQIMGVLLNDENDENIVNTDIPACKDALLFSEDLKRDKVGLSKLSVSTANQASLPNKLKAKSYQPMKQNNEPAKDISVNSHEKASVKKLLKGEYFCSECKFTFKYASAFNKHKKDGACVFICSYCGKKYTARYYSNFQLHLKYHSNDRQHVCTACGKAFAEKSKLTVHMRTHSNERPFVCDTCGQAFYTNMILRCHIKNIHKERPKKFTCELCDHKFVSVYNLNTHRNITHSTERPFECPVCHKTFKTKYALEKNHMPYHDENGKLFYCSSCPKSFKKKEYLNHHLKRHKNERTHFCDKCGKGFYDNKTLREHGRTHSGEKPYSCKVCEYKCALKGNLSKHMKTHENEEKEEYASDDQEPDRDCVTADRDVWNVEICSKIDGVGKKPTTDTRQKLGHISQEKGNVSQDPALNQRPNFYPDSYSVLALPREDISDLRSENQTEIQNLLSKPQNSISRLDRDHSKSENENRLQIVPIRPEIESSRPKNEYSNSSSLLPSVIRFDGYLQYQDSTSVPSLGGTCYQRVEPGPPQNDLTYTQYGNLFENVINPFSFPLK